MISHRRQSVVGEHASFGRHYFAVAAGPDGDTTTVVYENETKFQEVFNLENGTPYVKMRSMNTNPGRSDAVNPGRGDEGRGALQLEFRRQGSGDSLAVIQREIVWERKASERVRRILRRDCVRRMSFMLRPHSVNTRVEEKNVWRQRLPGCSGANSFYHYVVEDWLQGDSKQPAPSTAARVVAMRNGSISTTRYHLDAGKWEYPCTRMDCVH